jgi:demethylmenaquinone methyltransferase/2-methoxy-6-polyprenyl-1,4-benzoquinol methylase/phosphoethanolamine N-methyltransferase
LLSLGRAPAIRRLAVELAQVSPGDNVLDVGCGTGSLAIEAKAVAGSAGEVHGIDAAPEMIDAARRKAAKGRVDIDFQVGLIEDIPFPDHRFDLAVSSFMLHHLPDDLKRKGFAEIHRVLRPGGRFLAVDFGTSGNSLIGHLLTSLFGHGTTHSSVRELSAMMEAAGFTQVEEVETKYRQVSFVGAISGDSQSTRA